MLITEGYGDSQLIITEGFGTSEIVVGIPIGDRIVRVRSFGPPRIVGNRMSDRGKR